MFNRSKTKKKAISVTDLASYVADPEAFVRYKKQGLTSTQIKTGNEFHNSLHSKNHSLGVIHVLLVFIIVGSIFSFIVLSGSFSIF
ncbi:MAG: hypothetical protein ACI92O_000504 [Colwellia sp.]|jgi:hypothetical protein